MTKLSVLICTYNRPEMLDRALTALIDRTDEKPDQVVVVNGGDSRADQVVNSFVGHSNVRVQLVNTVNVNLAVSRNLGLSYCEGEIVAMTDDDAEVFPDWVSLHKRLHREHPEAGAVGGAVIGVSSQKSFLSRLSDVVTFVSPPEPANVRTLPGVNVSYKRQVLQQVGPQDESLFRGEDVDFNWRIQNLGYSIYYNPSVKVLHHHRPSLRRFLHQHHMYGRAYYLVRRKWTGMYCVYPHKITRFRDLLKLAYFFVAIFYEPLQFGCKLSKLTDRALAVPVLFLNQLAWKSGMICQSLKERQKK